MTEVQRVRNEVLEEVARFVDFYADERMLLCQDSILHDPVLMGGPATFDNLTKSRELMTDGTINSAAYHAATAIAAHIRGMKS